MTLKGYSKWNILFRIIKNEANMKQTKIMKWLVVLILLTVSGYYFISISKLQGSLMLVLTAIGLYLIETRLIDRYFDVIIRRKYVCIDDETVHKTLEELDSLIIIRPLFHQVKQVVEMINHHYEGRFDAVLSVTPPKPFGLVQIEWWYYMMYIYTQVVQGKQMNASNYEKLIQINAKRKKTLALEKHMMTLLALRQSGLNEDLLVETRKMEQANLQFAEVNYLLAQIQETDRMKNYYYKVAKNLAPDTYFGRSDSNV